MDKKRKKNYVLIGIITLIISIIGATFAYYTASAGNNSIVGNMATVSFDLSVVKKTNVDEVKGGLIPMTNAMVETAVNNSNNKGICVDDNNNAVCQIYKITVNNNGTASMLVDGYVTLTGGSGTPTDYPSSPTTMRWAQVFCNETNSTVSTCTTAGSPTVRQTNNISWSALGNGTGHDTGEIKDNFNNITTTGTISGNSYNVINTNYIRVSTHTGSNYTQAGDVTSALVYNQFLDPNDNNANNNTGDSSGTYTDSQVYYIVVWLSENGLDQTAGSGGTNVPNNRNNFFQGTVTFKSSEGSEVTGIFTGYTKVEPQTIYYTTNIRDRNNIADTIISIDSAIPGAITKYPSATAARNTFNNNPFYLKHILVNDIVKESYVNFVITPEMASANPGMHSGTYSLRGDNLYDSSGNCKSENIDSNTGYCRNSSYYESNVVTLKQAYGENTGYCTVGSGTLTNGTPYVYTRCTVAGLRANVSSSGSVYTVYGSVYGTVRCDVDYYGFSYCTVA